MADFLSGSLVSRFIPALTRVIFPLGHLSGCKGSMNQNSKYHISDTFAFEAFQFLGTTLN